MRAHATWLQLCPTLCNSKDRRPPGSSVHGILQAQTLPSSRGSSRPRDWTHVSYISWIDRWVLPSATWEAQILVKLCINDLKINHFELYTNWLVFTILLIAFASFLHQCLCVFFVCFFTLSKIYLPRQLTSDGFRWKILISVVKSHCLLENRFHICFLDMVMSLSPPVSGFASLLRWLGSLPSLGAHQRGKHRLFAPKIPAVSCAQLHPDPAS